jgi:molybdopterin-containing oxidoreductase family membrane subunit
VPSLERKFLPYTWGSYRPTWVEITLMSAGFGLMVLLYLLFSKLVPMISIWELKVGMHKAPAERAGAPVAIGAGAQGASRGSMITGTSP